MHPSQSPDSPFTGPPPTPKRAAMRSTRFAPVRLTEERLDAFHHVAHGALSQTVRDFVKLDGQSIDTKRWRYVRSRAGASVYYERKSSRKKHAALLVAGTIKARLADVMEGLYMDTTETTQLVQHHLNPRFVDAKVLKVIEQRSPELPYAFTGLKWALTKSSASGMVSGRDVCFLEKLGVVDITGGRKLGYFIMQSVDLPECPPSPSSRTVRAHISLCYLFEETRNGLVGMYMTGNMQQTGPKMLWKMARSNFAELALSVASAADVAHAKRCAALIRAKGVAIPAKHARGSVCELCHSLPSFFDRHHECCGCEKMSVCKKCRVKHDVLVRESSSSKRLARGTFCFDCMESVKNPAPPVSKRSQPEPERDGDDHFIGKEERHPPRGFKPLYDVEPFSSSFRNCDDIESPKGHRQGTMSTTETDEYFGYDEPEPDSERSLRMFTLKLHKELEDVGYDELDASSRHDGLAILGTGGRDSNDFDLEDDSDDEFASSGDVASLPSVGTNGAARNRVDSDEEEEILSVRPVRRSVQPPEMLEAQKLRLDGSLRYKPTSSYKSMSPDDLTRSLLTRLEEASLVAEKTYEQVCSRSGSTASLHSTEGKTVL